MKSLYKKNRDTCLQFWFGPRDTIALDTFRMLLGIALLFYMRERWLYASEWLTPVGFHPSAEALPYHPLAVPLLPEAFLPWFGFILFGSITAVIIGWQLSWMIWVAFGCVTYVTLADQLAAFTLNKLTIVALAVLGLAAKGPYWSIQGNKLPVQSVWPVRILQTTLMIHYFTAGWSKAYYGDWLDNPLALWSQVQGVYQTDFAAWLLTKAPLKLWVVMQYFTLFFELFAPILFTMRSTRRIALLLGCAFQVMIILTMHQLVYFMLVMFCFYVFFIPEETLHKGASLRNCLKV